MASPEGGRRVRAMSKDEWDRIIRSVKNAEHGPWTCPECAEFTVKDGHRFTNGKVVELTLLCFSCGAEVVAPA